MKFYILGALALSLLLLGCLQPPQQACTQEAKLCPDGSSVGRTGPNCEFAPCPAGNTTPGLVGNDSDSHGCIGSAGYSWCEQKQKCIRPWEENCTDSGIISAPSGNTGLANPASVYCGSHNGTLEIRDTPQGQAGYCVFPNGKECEEWAYFRGQCSQ